jgi:hypothetical protein
MLYIALTCVIFSLTILELPAVRRTGTRRAASAKNGCVIQTT